MSQIKQRSVTLPSHTWTRLEDPEFGGSNLALTCEVYHQARANVLIPWPASVPDILLAAGVPLTLRLAH